MMKFFRLLDDVHVNGRWHLGNVFQPGGDSSLELWNGVAMKLATPLKAEIDRVGKALDFCLTSFAVPVAKRKLGEAIDAIAGSDLQRFPLEIHGHQGFEVLNCVRVIKCLNE